MTQDQETTSPSTGSAIVEQYLLTGRHNNSRRGAINRLAQSIVLNWSDKSQHQKSSVIHDKEITSCKHLQHNYPLMAAS